MVPEIWELTRTFRSRIFQHITVPDILKTVFDGYDVDYQFVGTFEERNYCTQYQESDFDFASRLMEEEGIYYYFQFPKRGVHTMVIANTPQSHDDLPGDDPRSSSIRWTEVCAMKSASTIGTRRKLDFGKIYALGSAFSAAGQDLMAGQPVMNSVQVGSVTHQLKLGNADMEVYEHPGRYAYRFDGIDKAGSEKPDDLQKVFTDNKRTVGIRMDQTETPALLISGKPTTACSRGPQVPLCPAPFPTACTCSPPYRIRRRKEASAPATSATPSYRNGFTCLPFGCPIVRYVRTPADLPGAAERRRRGTRREEIFTDNYGRVKVQLRSDAKASPTATLPAGCRWIPWSGQNWGRSTFRVSGRKCW